jgi:thiol-disulfide isomerase/thioredoxin
VAIMANLDVKLDQYIAQHIPNVNITAGLENSGTVTKRLSDITGRKAKFVITASTGASSAGGVKLYELGPAPKLHGTQDWFNTPGDRPLTMASLRGRVVLVDFWTYSCINCIRTLPYLRAWYAKYHRLGLTIIGIHTPEFEFEHDAGNVASAIKQFGLRYPVVQDNDYAMWNAYGTQTWPSDYLIDAAGDVRYTAIGEGDYAQTQAAIRALLVQAGHAKLGAPTTPAGALAPSTVLTPETYLGTKDAYGWSQGPFAGRHDYGPPPRRSLAAHVFAISGVRTIAPQAATAGAHAGIDANVQAKDVYLVLGSAGAVRRRVTVSLDGRPIPAADAGSDVHDGVVTVRGQRLYSLVSLPSDQDHELTLRFAPGVSGYAFSFG